MPTPRILLSLGLSLLAGASALFAAAAEDDPADMERIDLRPCLYVVTDVGADARERRANARLYAERISETSQFFLQAFGIEARDFVKYAEFYDSPPENRFEPNIRIRVWQRRDDFLGDFQARYETETIPGAFFGIRQRKDEYGNPDGPWMREIGAYAEGQPVESVLRSLYHEMGHLFMETYMLYPFEVPSWIEEGTAELFQYRVDNGTDPMPVRIERLGELYEMVGLEDGAVGASIPWDDFTQVQNAHNLDFTHLDPLRSHVQYVQAWSVLEFMIGLDLEGRQEDRRRGRAFNQLLKLFKEQALQLNMQASQQGLNGQRRRDFLNQRIYRMQYDLIEECYGRDILTVEDLWKETLREQYEEFLDEYPELLYHRGAYHMDLRARFLDGGEREQALATAEELFRQAIERFPQHYGGYVGMGRLALRNDAIEDAGEWFAQATERGAESFEVLLYGGIALMYAGELEAAREKLASAVELRPTHTEANIRYGQALAASAGDDDQLRRAIEHFDIAANLDPDDRAWPSLLAGVVYYQLDDYRQAYIHLLRAQNGMRNHFLPPLMIAVIKHSNAEIADAQAFVQQAAAISPQGAQRLKQMMDAGAVSIGFGPDGHPGIHGLTIPPADGGS